MNGWINPLEMSQQNLTVLSSHNHPDHFDSTIWQWGNSIKNINYILGFSTFDTAPNRIYIEPHTTKEVNGIKITPVISNDSGEGFLIEVDGVTIFHPGDLASSTRDISPDFKSEIEYIAGLGKSIDMIFLPVVGCSFPDIEAVKLGDLWAIGKLKPKVIFPMHGDALGYNDFAKRVSGQFKNQDIEVAGNRGDRFLYMEGKTKRIDL
jgi:L-ascorbate metabolism protein UlaG (beta-lactamase superfamily)